MTDRQIVELASQRFGPLAGLAQQYLFEAFPFDPRMNTDERRSEFRSVNIRVHPLFKRGLHESIGKPKCKAQSGPG